MSFKLVPRESQRMQLAENRIPQMLRYTNFTSPGQVLTSAVKWSLFRIESGLFSGEKVGAVFVHRFWALVLRILS